MKKAIVLNSKDNVATAFSDLKSDEKVEVTIGERVVTIVLKSSVPFGHKFSLDIIEPGSPIIKYGEVIGAASASIEPGDYVHTHNVASTRGRGDLDGGVE